MLDYTACTPLTYKPHDSGHYPQCWLYFYGPDTLQMLVCQVGLGLVPKGQGLAWLRQWSEAFHLFLRPKHRRRGPVHPAQISCWIRNHWVGEIVLNSYISTSVLTLRNKHSGLQASFMSSNVTYAYGVLGRKQPDAPRPPLGWNRNQQLEDWAFYIASGSTGYLMLIVFGTTRESRAQARRLWASFRGKARAARGGGDDNGYVSFRDSAMYNTEARSGAPGANERRRTPKPMTFVNSGGPPLRSPDESYNNIDLKTPRM